MVAMALRGEEMLRAHYFELCRYESFQTASAGGWKLR